METTMVNLGNEWTKIIDTADPQWIVQNSDLSTVYVIYSDTTPTIGRDGMVLKTGEGLTSGIHGAGNVWARSKPSKTDGMIAVTK